MKPRENALRSLLSDHEFDALKYLADAATPVTGRQLSRALSISPTTASSVLAKLRRAGFATSATDGSANRWQLNSLDPTMADWLAESEGVYLGVAVARSRLKVVLLTALPLEYEAIADHLDFDGSTSVNGIRFEHAIFDGESVIWDVYAAQIGMGNVFSGIVASAAYERFTPDLGLFVGVAGSVKPEDLCRGDVLLPDRVYDLGSGKEVWTEDGPEVLIRPMSTEAPLAATQFALSISRGDWMAEQRRVRPDIQPYNEQGATPRCAIRSLAATNRVLSDGRSALVQSLRTNYNDVAAVDMESLGFYQAARFYGIPALSVRGISDHVTDKTASDDEIWQPVSASHAASFAFTLLLKARAQDVAATEIPPGEPPDGGSRPTPSPPNEPAGGVAGADVEDRELLFRLPPGVAVAHAWARRYGDETASRIAQTLDEHRSDPSQLLNGFQSSSQGLFEQAFSAPTVLMVAEFAVAHDHSSAPQLFADAASLAGTPIAAALLFARGAWSAMRHLDQVVAVELLARATNAAPSAGPLWDFFRIAFEADAPRALERAPSLASAFGLRLPILASARPQLDDSFVPTVEEALSECPELLDLTRLHTAVIVADLLRRLDRFGEALQVLEGLSEDGAPIDAGVAWALLVGPRSSAIPLEIARTLCMRIASATDTGLGGDADMARAFDLAMVARDRRIDWSGPTAEALAIAAEAKVRAGDPKGALRLLLPPPEGTATSSEATAAPIVDLAPGIAYMTGDVQLTLNLANRVTDPVERRIITALALARRQDSHPEAAAEFRSVLAEPSVLQRVDQRVRALLGLATVAELNSDDEQHLEGLDRETQDLVRAQSRISGGNLSEAQVLMRPHRGGMAELQIAVEVLVSQGKSTDAIDRLEQYAISHGQERLLLQAAAIATSAGSLERADHLAARVTASEDAARRRMALEMQVDIAQRRGDWARVNAETRRLLNEISGSDDTEAISARSRYRWARVNALFQERNFFGAYAELDAEPPLEASTEREASLVIAILRSVAPEALKSGPAVSTESAILQRDVLRKASVIARRFPNEEEVVAGALIASLSMPTDGEMDPSELIEARELQDEFFESFPDSTLIRRISVPDTPDMLASMISEQLAAAAGPLDQMARGVFTGRIPLAVLAAAAQRSYAQALVQNAGGAYVLAALDSSVTATEVAAAGSALNNDVVVDTSALFHASRVLGDDEGLLLCFSRLLMPGSLRDDILMARSELSRRIVGSFGWDSAAQRPSVAFYDDETADRWAASARELAETLSWCDVVSDAPYGDDPRNRIWSAAINLAKDRSVPVMADDVALRYVARLEGVETFGSLQVLMALVESGRVATTELEAAIRRLQSIAAADLPLLDPLTEIAAREEWLPSGYAGFLLTRPTTWVPPSAGIQLYIDLVRSLPDRKIDAISRWCAVAARGLALAVPSQVVALSVGSLVAWTVLEWQGPEALPLLLPLARRVVAELAPDADLLREVVRRLVSTLRQIVPLDAVSQVLLQLAANLDEPDRRKVVEYVLESS